MSKGKRARKPLPAGAAPFVPANLADAALLQGGFEVAFFLGGDFVAHRVGVCALFDHWLTLVPPRTLTWAWIGPHTNRANRFAAKTIDRCKDQLTAKRARNAFFHSEGHRVELRCVPHRRTPSPSRAPARERSASSFLGRRRLTR